MKFITSFLLLLGTASASPIVISFEGERGDAEIYREILRKDYLIPDELISLTATAKCEKQRPAGKVDFCLKNNGDLYLVSVDRTFIEESLKVFRAP
jgi:hypothetical protein